MLMARPGTCSHGEEAWTAGHGWAKLCPGSCSASLSVQVQGRDGRPSPGAETWFSYPLLMLGREHRHELEGIPESLTLQPKIFIFKTVSHRLFLFGVNTKLSNFGKEETITQLLFEETTEIADAKIKITTQKNQGFSNSERNKTAQAGHGLARRLKSWQETQQRAD